MSKQVIQVRAMGPTGSIKDLIMAHRNCGGGILQWDPNQDGWVVCKGCDIHFRIFDKAKLRIVASGERSAVDVERALTDVASPGTFPQRYEQMTQDLFERVVLQLENTELTEQKKTLIELLRYAIEEIGATKSITKSSRLADLRQYLETRLRIVLERGELHD
jgi:hypothetical protein